MPKNNKIYGFNIPGRTEERWNISYGCDNCEVGCECWALKMIPRLHVTVPESAFTWKRKEDGKLAWTGTVHLIPERLKQPLVWNKPRFVSVEFMGDLFAHNVPFEFIAAVKGVASVTGQHWYMNLTKFPERVIEFEAWLTDYAEMVKSATTGGSLNFLKLHFLRTCALNYGLDITAQAPNHGIYPLPNWIQGVSATNQETWDTRTDLLKRIPAARRVVSLEPMHGPVTPWEYNDWDGVLEGAPVLANYGSTPDSVHGPREDFCDTYLSIDWLIAGGGPWPVHPRWVETLKLACETGDGEPVPFWWKQWGKYGTKFKCGKYTQSKPFVKTDIPYFLEYYSYERFFNNPEWMNGGLGLDMTGKVINDGVDFAGVITDSYPVAILHKLGKHKTGALVDGQLLQELPEWLVNGPPEVSSND